MVAGHPPVGVTVGGDVAGLGIVLVAKAALDRVERGVARTPGTEPAARGRSRGVGRLALQGNATAAALQARIGQRNGVQQRACVGMGRIAVHIVHGPDLQDAAEVHDGDTVGDAPDDRQIMGDEQVRQAETGAQLLQQVHDTGLHGHVQGRYWLVQEQQSRSQGERPGDAHALPLPAGQAMWVALRVDGLQTHQLQQLPDAVADPGRRHAVRGQRLGEDVGDAHPRVQGRERVLEDDLDVAPQGPAMGGAQGGRVLAEDGDAPPLRAGQPQDLHQRRGLAAARLAHQRERLPLPDVESDAVHGAHGTGAALEERPPVERVVTDEILHLQHDRTLRPGRSPRSRHSTHSGVLYWEDPSGVDGRDRVDACGRVAGRAHQNGLRLLAGALHGRDRAAR
ncbi:hypothetical protein E1298_21005 [Actinomadura rubrisoli]|uniref:Uncharacterized protein n=1 Tax=Actinomadura rubrisoli TaxID=2530368 RepID=A0A4R5BDG9_9ACTN|nr:hypothetical protein E1298_21005 [Actinomadura rubrisoli]